MLRSYSLLLFLSALTIFAVTLGLISSGNPLLTRQKEFDKIRSANLQRIYQVIEAHFNNYGKLPNSLQEIGGLPLQDPETHQAYDYKTHADYSFELCATFLTRHFLPNQLPGEYQENNADRHDRGYQCIRYQIPEAMIKALRERSSATPINNSAVSNSPSQTFSGLFNGFRTEDPQGRQLVLNRGSVSDYLFYAQAEILNKSGQKIVIDDLKNGDNLIIKINPSLFPGLQAVLIVDTSR